MRPDSDPAGKDRRLDNPAWHTLMSRDAHLAESRKGARRYRRDVSIFYGVDQADATGWAGLAELAGPGRGVAVGDAIDWLPPGWSRLERLLAHQMVLTDVPAESSLDLDDGVAQIRRLHAGDRHRMLELARLTRPGPFRERTLELGGYIGAVMDDRLVAMAGERMHLPGFTEISAVCTHPDVRRRGLAGALTRRVATAIIDRGEVPFLHVADDNESARRIYEQMGFVTRRIVAVEILRSSPSGRQGPA